MFLQYVEYLSSSLESDIDQSWPTVQSMKTCELLLEFKTSHGDLHVSKLILNIALEFWK